MIPSKELTIKVMLEGKVIKRRGIVLTIIDIDQLLFATEELAEESIPFHLDAFDIDQLLDKTDNW
jgi:hypothetical protein